MYDHYLFSMIISSYMRPLWYTMYEIVKQALYRTMSPRTNCLEKHTTLVLYEYIVIWRVDSQSLSQTSAHSIIQLSFGVKTRLHGCHPLHLDLQTCTSALLYLVEKTCFPLPFSILASMSQIHDLHITFLGNHGFSISMSVYPRVYPHLSGIPIFFPAQWARIHKQKIVTDFAHSALSPAANWAYYSTLWQ